MPYEQVKKPESATKAATTDVAATKAKAPSTLEDRGFTMNTGIQGPPDIAKNPMYARQLAKDAPKPESQKVQGGAFEIVSDQGKYLSDEDFQAAVKASWIGSKMDQAMREKWLAAIQLMLSLGNKMQCLDLRAALSRLQHSQG